MTTRRTRLTTNSSSWFDSKNLSILSPHNPFLSILVVAIQLNVENHFRMEKGTTVSEFVEIHKIEKRVQPNVAHWSHKEIKE